MTAIMAIIVGLVAGAILVWAMRDGIRRTGKQSLGSVTYGDTQLCWFCSNQLPAERHTKFLFIRLKTSSSKNTGVGVEITTRTREIAVTRCDECADVHARKAQNKMRGLYVGASLGAVLGVLLIASVSPQSFGDAFVITLAFFGAEFVLAALGITVGGMFPRSPGRRPATTARTSPDVMAARSSMDGWDIVDDWFL
jgi:hypothetical protein